jgi:hypothetical protein
MSTIGRPDSYSLRRVEVVPAKEENVFWADNNYVEIYYNIHISGGACEPLLIEVFPENSFKYDETEPKNSYCSNAVFRTVKPKKLTDSEVEEFHKLSAAIAKVTCPELWED